VGKNRYAEMKVGFKIVLSVLDD